MTKHSYRVSLINGFSGEQEDTFNFYYISPYTILAEVKKKEYK